jgi:hypothetical protein
VGIEIWKGQGNGMEEDKEAEEYRRIGDGRKTGGLRRIGDGRKTGGLRRIGDGRKKE